MTVTFYFKTALPVKKYGGTERIVYWLMKELVKKGHRVFLIGDEHSEVSSIGVSLIPCTSGEDWRLLIPKATDIIQLFQNTADIDIPSLNTIEGNEVSGTVFPINTVFVSKNHAMRHHSESFIYNGIDFDEYPPPPCCEEKEKSAASANLLFLANGGWNVKNLKDCIRAAVKTKRHLYAAGASRIDCVRVFRTEGGHKYFNEGLRSLFSPYIHPQGMVEQSKKFPLFWKCGVLLWPVRWHEPFGIAIIEAYSQGLPVIGSRYGSLPEIIPEPCGILCGNYAQFLEALSFDTRQFDPTAIRDYCWRNFSSSVMADNYVRYYERVLSGEAINRTAPYSENSTELLPF